jgi:hypothetical protein
MCTDPYIVQFGKLHGAPDGLTIPGMKSTGYVGGGNVRHQGFIIAHAFTHIAINIYGPQHLRSLNRVS